MFKWSLAATVQECAGVVVTPNHQYTLLMRFDNKFSPPSPPARASGSRLPFNAVLEVEFQTEGEGIPAQNVSRLEMQMQILLVSSAPSGKGVEGREEIIGMATIKISFPLTKDAQSLRIHKFDKSFDSKATLKASLCLQRAQIPQTPQSSNEALPPDALEQILGLQREQKEAYQSHLKFLQGNLSEELIQECGKDERRNGKWQQMVKERDELYKMSEDLYQQLKKCMSERDQYLKELREKERVEQQIRHQLDFLKLKIEEHEGAQPETAYLVEIEQLRDENADLSGELYAKEAENKELKRQVRESLVAMDQFRKEALQARSELIHRESELSIITKQSRYLDPYDCILELHQQLESRRLQDPLCFQPYPASPTPAEETVRALKKQTALLFTQLLQKMKLAKDRAWLLQSKVRFQSLLDVLLVGE